MPAFESVSKLEVTDLWWSKGSPPISFCLVWASSSRVRKGFNLLYPYPWTFVKTFSIFHYSHSQLSIKCGNRSHPTSTRSSLAAVIPGQENVAKISIEKMPKLLKTGRCIESNLFSPEPHRPARRSIIQNQENSECLHKCCKHSTRWQGERFFRPAPIDKARENAREHRSIPSGCL